MTALTKTMHRISNTDSVDEYRWQEIAAAAILAVGMIAGAILLAWVLAFTSAVDMLALRGAAGV